MRLKLDTASYYVDEEKKKLYEELGFRYIPYEPGKLGGTFETPMWTKDHKIETTIELSTLEELLKFIKRYGEIVMDEDEITIYDSSLE